MYGRGREQRFRGWIVPGDANKGCVSTAHQIACYSSIQAGEGRVTGNGTSTSSSVSWISSTSRAPFRNRFREGHPRPPEETSSPAMMRFVAFINPITSCFLGHYQDKSPSTQAAGFQVRYTNMESSCISSAENETTKYIMDQYASTNWLGRSVTNLNGPGKEIEEKCR